MRVTLIFFIAIALANEAAAALAPMPPGGNGPVQLDSKALDQISEQVSKKVRAKLIQDLTALKPDVAPGGHTDIKVTPGDCSAVQLDLAVQKRTNAKIQQMWEDDVAELNLAIAALKDDLAKQKDLVAQRDKEIADLKKSAGVK